MLHPFSLNTAHNAPVLLREKAQVELQRMQALGVIAPIKEPTPWCSDMVVVPNKSGQVRICVFSMTVCDNGPQYSSQQVSSFIEEYRFEHVTSSPHYPHANGLAERAIQTIKSLLQKSIDPYLTLLAYRSTPLPWCVLSPAQLLMGCIIRSTIPEVPQFSVL